MISIQPGRPTLCFIDHRALRWNFAQVRKLVGAKVKILAMIKANGYGHGAAALAKTLQASGSDAFGVATVEEGLELRRARIRGPIVVLAGFYIQQLHHFLKHRLTPVVHELATLRALDRQLQKRRTHMKVELEVDTGMGRIGFPAREINSWLPALVSLKAVTLQGVFSHFANAERVNEKYSREQYESFRNVLSAVDRTKVGRDGSHMAKSAALLTLPETHLSMVRPGLVLYGMYPAAALQNRIALRPVLSWKTRIIQLKRVPAGTSIGYGRTFVANRSALIATLPVGYADGYRRHLSNRGSVLVRGQRAPIAGRVSMDLTTVDVTDIANVQQGDEVVLLGRQGADEIGADEMAKWCGTISYEIFTSIGNRVPRIHINT